MTATSAGRPGQGGEVSALTITCGVTHLLPVAEQITRAIRESEGFVQSEGCGRPFDLSNPVLLAQLYRCVECGRWLCKPCILRHFAGTSDHLAATLPPEHRAEEVEPS